MPAHRQVLVVMAAAVFALAGCTSEQRDSIKDDLDPGQVTEKAAVAACRIESKAVVVAYQAAAAARDAGQADADVRDFLVGFSSGNAEMFALEDGPTTGPIERNPDTLDRVTEDECPAIPVDEVPVGSI